MTQAPADTKSLGRYQLVHLLGQGGMGEVYLAKISGAAGFEKPCIVKTILPSLLGDRQFLDRFHHEAKVLVHLVHSNIAQVYDMGESEGTYFMALEYVPGVDLGYVQDQLAAQRNVLPVPIALYLSQKMAEGLGYAHRKTGTDGLPLGIVHRDVSPQNVMVSYEGEVKLIDFGLAKSAARSKHTLPSTVMGKLGYMSPEQARGDVVDQRSDIYSCAVVVHELLTGQPLVPRGTMGEMMAWMSSPKPVPVSAFRPDVGSEVEAILAKALAPRADERFERADDFARALNTAAVRAGLQADAENVGSYVKGLCPEAYATQRKLISSISSGSLRRTPVEGHSDAAGQLATMAARHRSPIPGGGDDDTAFGATTVRQPTPAPTREPAPPAAAPPTPTSASFEAASRRSWLPLVSVLVGGLGLGAAAMAYFLVRNARAPEPAQQAQVQAQASAPVAPPEPEKPTETPPAPPSQNAALEPAQPEPPPATAVATGDTPSQTGDGPAPTQAPPEEQELSAAAPNERERRRAKHSAAAAERIDAGPVAEMFRDRGAAYVRAGSTQGLAVGGELQLVGRMDEKRKRPLVGSATVLEVWPKLARVKVDQLQPSPGKLFAVLPEASGRNEPTAAAKEPTPAAASAPAPTGGAEPASGASPPNAAAEPAKPAEPARLIGQATAVGLGDVRAITLHNRGGVIWTGCNIVVSGQKQAYLGRVLPGEHPTIGPTYFRHAKSAPAVGANEVQVTCTEGQSRFSLGRLSL